MVSSHGHFSEKKKKEKKRGPPAVSESALARMHSYEGKKITSPSRGFEV